MKPALKATHAVDESVGQIIPFPRSHRNPPVLLLADDDASARQALAERLRAKDFIVYEAASGVEAIDIAELRQPDLILLDTRMPDTDGVQALHDLKAIPDTSNIPVFALAPPTQLNEREMHLAAGAVQFMEKPLCCDQLALAITGFFSTQQQQNKTVSF